MQLEPIRHQVRAGTFDLGGFARALVVSLIDAEQGEERAARIQIALKDGHITQPEADRLAAEQER